MWSLQEVLLSKVAVETEANLVVVFQVQVEEYRQVEQAEVVPLVPQVDVVLLVHPAVAMLVHPATAA
jgi:hypothetical protein